MLKGNELSNEYLEKLINIRHHLHEYPELSNQEYQTTAFIKNYLEKRHITILPTSLETGVIGEIIGTKEGPTIALRADIDALPIIEATGLKYASKNKGVMHACGHDFHTTALLGAAAILKKEQEQLAGRIILIFQPAEEDNGGAKRIVQSGVLDDVTAIIGFHNKPDLPLGTIGIKEGPLMAAVDRFEIKIKGTGTHAAAPHNGSDPVVTACQIVNALQGIVSRHVSPLETAILSVSHISGGNTWNVIPETVLMEGTIRTFNSDVQRQVKLLTEQIVAHYPAAFNQEGSISWIDSPPAVQNDKELAKKVTAVTSKFAQVVEPEVTLGGEDFAYYQQKIPGVFAFIGTESPYEWHHPSFQIDDQALKYAVRYYVDNCQKLLESD